MRKKKINSFWLTLVLILLQTGLFLFFGLPFYIPISIFLIFLAGFHLLVSRGFEGRALILMIVLWIFLSLLLFFGLFYLNREVFLAQKFLFAFLFFLCYFSTSAFLAWLYDFGFELKHAKSEVKIRFGRDTS